MKTQKHRLGRLRYMPAALALLPLLIALTMSFPGTALGQGPEPEATTATVKIKVGTTVTAHISANYFGLDMTATGHGSADSSFFYRTDEGQSKLAELGVNSLNYSADRNDWAALYDITTAVPLNDPDKIETPEYLALNGKIGSEPMIAVNVTTVCRQADPSQPPSSSNVTCTWATPAMAASWVQSIKNTAPGTLKYVLLGEEPYGGCNPLKEPKGINCVDVVNRHRVELTGTQYAQKVKDWSKAIKAVDPNIKIGAGLQPNTRICDKGNTCAPWDQTVLQTAGSAIDFVYVHQYFAVDAPATKVSDAQKYSYYQKQIDMRILQQGQTAMPSQIRRELLRWLPKKKNMPIFVTEYNAARLADTDGSFDDALKTRQSLYSAFSIGELFLDLPAQVKIGGYSLQGASRINLHDLYTSPVMIARQLPLDQPQMVLYMPGWHALSMLKGFAGRDLLSVQVLGSPITPVNLPALRAFAAKSGTRRSIALFNHGNTAALNYELTFTGFVPHSGTITSLGETAGSFLTVNDIDHPTALVPTVTTIPASKLGKSKLTGSIPPHTILVLSLAQ